MEPGSGATLVTYTVPASGESFVSGAFDLTGLPSLPALRASWPFAGPWALRLRVRAGDVGPGVGTGELGDDGFVWLDLTGTESAELLAAACAPAGAAAVRGLPLNVDVLAYDGSAAAAAKTAHSGDFDLDPEQYDRWRSTRALARGLGPSPRPGDSVDRSGTPPTGAGWEDASGGGSSSIGGGDAAAAVGGFFKGVFAAAAGATGAASKAVAAASKGSGGWFSSISKSLGGGSGGASKTALGDDDEFPGSAPSADAPVVHGRTPGGVDIEWRR